MVAWRSEHFVPSGKFSGKNPTLTEEESGAAVEKRELGPMKPGKLGHRVLEGFADGEALTAYEISHRLFSGDWHRYRREPRRLYDRGFLSKVGIKKNQAPGGRRVDVFQINDAGRAELARLGPFDAA